jgi:threonine dehydratase
MIELQQIEAAAARLQSQLLRTPCVASRTLTELTGAQVFLKFENLQFTASFKERGACNKLAQLSAAERERGVIAMSAGNHAQGVAYHAQRLGLRAVIVMPRFTPGVKVERTRGFGAEVLLHGDTLEEAHQHALQLAAEQGLVFVHPYDDADIIAGQGTVALEMLQDLPELDMLVVAVGGGGLLAGMATAARAAARHRADRGADHALSGHGQRHSGHPLPPGQQQHCRGHRGGHARAADPRHHCPAGGRPAAGRRGRHRAGHCDAAGGGKDAGRRRRCCRPGRAAATPAALSGQAGRAGAVRRQHRALAAGGHHRARHGARRAAARIRVSARDVPGTLARITATVAAAGANIDEVHHQRAFTALAAQNAEVELVIQTRGPQHIAEVLAQLLQAGMQAEQLA